MKEKALLTIAIPTYNRKETLERILLQLRDEPQTNVRILISDDHSTDGTPEMIRKYQKEMSSLVYHRNPKNLGYSGNVCTLYELTQTEYIWYLCDDDSVLPGAIESILKKIQRYKPTVAIFNCTWVDPLGRIITAGVKKDHFSERVAEITDYQSLMRLTYLSLIVIQKSFSLDEIKKTDYEDNIFFQLTLGLYLLSRKPRFLEADKAIVHRNVGYKYGEFYKFYLVDHLKAIFAIHHAFDNKKFITWSKKQLFPAFSLYLSQKLGLFVYHGKPTNDTIDKLYTYYGKLYGKLFLAFPYVAKIVPSILLQVLFFLQLVRIHGFSEAKKIYTKNINRATSDSRKTKFTTYR